MKLALITFSREGMAVVNSLWRAFPDARAFAHESVANAENVEKFASVMALTKEIFARFDGLVYVAPCGVVVRAIAPNLESKLTDPAVVQVDVGGRYAVSLLSGHEGGANDLAVAVANVIGAVPVISTTTEAVKNIIVGVGCRKGKEADKIVEAINHALELVKEPLSKVRFIASADVKSNEPGLIEAAKILNVPVRFITSDEIRAFGAAFAKSEFVEKNVNLPAVAEPSAMLAGRRTELLLPKIKLDGITVAVARENCTSLE